MAAYGNRGKRRTAGTAQISTKENTPVNRLAEGMASRQAQNKVGSAGAHFNPTRAQAQANQPQRQAPPLNLRDLQRNVQAGSMTKDRAASVGAQRATLFNAGGGGKDWRQKLYGSDFKTGDFAKLKAQIAFGDAASAQGAPLPGNLTTDTLTAAKERYAKLIAARKKALGQA